MIDALHLAVACLTGVLLGGFFFGGLWWTVRKGVASQRAALWFFASMLLRTSMVTLGFYVVMGDSWQRLLAGLFGFVIARVLVIQLTRVALRSSQLQQGDGHAL
jgi:F1F0 ATPase subunit 2